MCRFTRNSVNHSFTVSNPHAIASTIEWLLTEVLEDAILPAMVSDIQYKFNLSMKRQNETTPSRLIFSGYLRTSFTTQQQQQQLGMSYNPYYTNCLH